MLVRYELLKSKNTPAPSPVSQSLAERIAKAPTKHPGLFALDIWTVENCPSGGQVSSLYGLAGSTP